MKRRTSDGSSAPQTQPPTGILSPEYVDPYEDLHYSERHVAASPRSIRAFESRVEREIRSGRNKWFEPVRVAPSASATRRREGQRSTEVAEGVFVDGYFRDVPQSARTALRLDKTVRLVRRFVCVGVDFKGGEAEFQSHLKESGLRVESVSRSGLEYLCTPLEKFDDELGGKGQVVADREQDERDAMGYPTRPSVRGPSDFDANPIPHTEDEKFLEVLTAFAQKIGRHTEEEREEYEAVVEDHVRFAIVLDKDRWRIVDLRVVLI